MEVTNSHSNSTQIEQDRTTNRIRAYGKAGTGKWKRRQKMETDMENGNSSDEAQDVVITSISTLHLLTKNKEQTPCMLRRIILSDCSTSCRTRSVFI